MKITDHLNNAKKTLFSIEILPPLKEYKNDRIYNIQKLLEISWANQ